MNKDTLLHTEEDKRPPRTRCYRARAASTEHFSSMLKRALLVLVVLLDVFATHASSGLMLIVNARMCGS